ncbi:alkaline phosphatase family protein [Tautonia plasticadhaerens]|uniref:Type I phosphodiesterase / nucleotide pyrophosphatase n=1 Tax=Tautonia plasticadhaerens TaxID=2527974 RepID=A0A518GX88_9BACT|nr:nucleotide pyrophosphatase/phosphodiesterase family protein [Tautonia plasticadhaerens]QDV33214.1 Type I phosphodiesterase / nucleotide pyrophosphatase [Tautonia plasticadhaerens]
MPESSTAPIVLVSAVGLTRTLLPMAPRLSALAGRGWSRPVLDCEPAVTCSAQATLLTGRPPRDHGIVGNGWLFRDTREIRFWQQSNALIQSEPLYETARRRAADRGRSLRVAKLFWWYNQGAEVDLSVTPKPLYGADGGKVFGIWGSPPELPARLERLIGPFPFPSFWGPMAGLPATRWIARCAAEVLSADRPDLTLVYLPHLDYEPQRLGPSGCDMARLVGELDEAAAPLLDAAKAVGARVWVFGEYGHSDVVRPVLPNRALRDAGMLAVRPGPYGDQLETFQGRAFAVCDHQHAHVYVQRAEDLREVRDLLVALPGVDRAFIGEERAEIGLDHSRSGEIVLRAASDAWFAYPFWLDDAQAPDYARTVDIHRKPGYDPCELFFDPSLTAPKIRAMRRLIQKKLGFRTLMDLIPLDPSIVRGSHGCPSESDDDRPVLIGDGPAPPPNGPWR